MKIIHHRQQGETFKAFINWSIIDYLCIHRLLQVVIVVKSKRYYFLCGNNFYNWQFYKKDNI